MAARAGVLVLAIAASAAGNRFARERESCRRTVGVERYDNGLPRRQAEYCDGQLDGTTRGWYENGAVMFVYHYRHGLGEGTQRQWYRSGAVLTSFHHHEGHESGQQQMWNADGTIRSNYVIRDGKRYGLLGTMGCTGKRADSVSTR